MKNKNPLPNGNNRLPEYKELSRVFNKILIAALSLIVFFAACKKDEYNQPGAGIIPAITFTNPVNSDTGFGNSNEIIAIFNEAMEPSTINTATFTLQQGSTTVPGTVTYLDSSANFSPTTDLLPNTAYTATITTDAKDLTHHSMLINYVWHFITKGLDHYEMTRRSTAVTDFVRDGSKLMQMGSYMYSFGGWTASPEESYNDVYRSHGDLSTWEKLPNAPWHGRHTFGIDKIGSTLYILGGDYIHNVFDVWKSTDGENFSEVANNLQTTIGSRLLYGACSHNNKLFVLGGQSNLGLGFGLNDVWSSLNGSTWTRLSSNETFLGKNISGSVVSFNGKIWVIGGGYYDHPDPATRWTNDVFSSPDGINWVQQPEAPWAGRQYTDVCVWDNKLWMVGGNNGPNLADIWYMKKDGTWVQFEVPEAYIGRHATAVGVYNNKLVITCGNYNNDCWVIEKGH